jgi:hypothetical protein
MSRFPTLSPWRRRALVFLSAAVCAAAFRVVLPSRTLAVNMKESSDYHGTYAPVARRILQGRGPVLEDGTPLTRYPPGYPFLLAGAFAASEAIGVDEERALTLLHIASFALAALLLFEIASQLWPWPRTLLAPLAFSSYPLALWATTLAGTETVFLPVLYACFLAFCAALRVRGLAVREGLACGLSAGIAMMIRPAAIGLGLLMGRGGVDPGRTDLYGAPQHQGDHEETVSQVHPGLRRSCRAHGRSSAALFGPPFCL